MVRHSDPEVLVVGAGPVGLVAALFLERYGVRARIVDTHQRAHQHSYALAIHPRTLAVFDEAGLSDTLIAAGRKLTKVAFYEGRERRADIDYSRLESPHPYLLVVRQSLLERTVEEALKRRDRHVLWGHRLQALVPDGEGVQTDIAELDQVATGYPVARTEWVVGQIEKTRSAFVIGADGYDSAVRRLAGIEMTEHRAAEIFSIFEIEASGDLSDEVRIVLDRDATSVYWPLEKGRCRWGFQIADANAHEPTVERLRQMLAARAPWFTAQPSQIYWSTLASFASRLAKRFGAGHVWLAGDAAHHAAPVAVRSMNSGLVEAREIASRMSRIQHSSGSASLLQEYAGEMHEVWEAMLDSARTAGARPNADPWVKEHAARIVACTPASGNDLVALVGQIGLTPANGR